MRHGLLPPAYELRSQPRLLLQAIVADVIARAEDNATACSGAVSGVYVVSVVEGAVLHERAEAHVAELPQRPLCESRLVSVNEERTHPEEHQRDKYSQKPPVAARPNKVHVR